MQRRFLGFLLLGCLFLTVLSPARAAGLVTREQAVVDFATACLDPSGGAMLHPGAGNPTVSTTFAIAKVIDILDAWSTVNTTILDRDVVANMTSWVQGLHNTTSAANNRNYGGFHSAPGIRVATLTATYYAVQTLFILNQTYSIETGIVLNFTAELQRVNATQYPDTVGGFADRADAPATLAATYYALETLNIYGELSRINSSLAVSWIASCQVLDQEDQVNYGGFVNARNSSTASLQCTFMALRSLEILGALSAVNQTAALQFILSCYHEDPNYPHYAGGFGETPDDIVSTQLATYQAVISLQILNAESHLHVEEIVNWVLDKQVADGGFADTASGGGLAPQTYLALSTLAALDQLARLGEQVPWEVVPYIFPWWIVAAVVVVVVLVVCAVLARRKEWF